MDELDLTQFKDMIGNLSGHESAFELESILREVKGTTPPPKSQPAPEQAYRPIGPVAYPEMETAAAMAVKPTEDTAETVEEPQAMEVETAPVEPEIELTESEEPSVPENAEYVISDGKDPWAEPEEDSVTVDELEAQETEPEEQAEQEWTVTLPDEQSEEAEELPVSTEEEVGDAEEMEYTIRFDDEETQLLDRTQEEEETQLLTPTEEQPDEEISAEPIGEVEEEFDEWDEEESEEPEETDETDETEPEEETEGEDDLDEEKRKQMLAADAWKPKYDTPHFGRSRERKHFWDGWEAPEEPELDEDGERIAPTKPTEETGTEEEKQPKNGLFSRLFRPIEEENIDLPEEKPEDDSFQGRKSGGHFWDRWLAPDVPQAEEPQDVEEQTTDAEAPELPVESTEEPTEEPDTEPKATAEQSEPTEPEEAASAPTEVETEPNKPKYEPEPPTISEEEFRAFMEENTVSDEPKVSFEQLMRENGTEERVQETMRKSEEVEDDKRTKTQYVYVDLGAKKPKPVQKPAVWAKPKKVEITHYTVREFPEPKWLHMSIEEIAEIAPVVERHGNEPVLLSEIRHLQQLYQKNRQKPPVTVRSAQKETVPHNPTSSPASAHAESSEDGGDEDGPGGIRGSITYSPERAEIPTAQEPAAQPETTPELPKQDIPEEQPARKEEQDKHKESLVPNNAKEGYQRWNRRVRSLGRRSIWVGILSLLAIVLSASATMNLPVPSILSYAYHPEVYFSVLIGLTVLGMLFGGDMLWDGLRSLVQRKANFSTLVTLTLMLTIVHSAVQIVQPTGELTYPCIALTALFVLMRARMAQATASRNTYRMAAEHTTLTGVYLHTDGATYLEKRPLEDTQYFVRAAAYDAWDSRVERLYTPIVTAVALVLALIVVAATRDSGRFLFAFSAMLAVACQLGLLLAVGLACRGTTQRLSKDSAALAGMAASIRMADAPQIRLTEEDLFPAGSIRLDDYIDLRGDLNEEEALAYAAAVQLDTAIGKVLAEALRQRYGEPLQAESIVQYDNGGRRGQVQGKDVVLGTAACMQEQKIPIPSLPNEKESLFLAVDGTTQAVFEITYSITNAVYAAMQALEEHQTGVLLEVQDCPLSVDQLADLLGVKPGMIQLAERTERTEGGELLAVLTRDNTGAFADCIDAACQLGRLSAAGVLLGTAAAALGILLAAYLSFVFAPLGASPIRMLLYALLWFIPTYYMENETKKG